MRKLGRKCTSALLALALLVSLLPAGAVPAQAAGEGNHDISQGTLTISEDGSYTVTGMTTTNRIVVGENVTATVTLNGVTVTGVEESLGTGAPPQSPIDLADGATLTLILAEGSTNTLTGGAGTSYRGAPGIHVPDKASLIIQGSGSLSVTGGSYSSGYGAPGIGGNVGEPGASGYGPGENCGTVIILTENVTATGGDSSGSDDAVDIGGGDGSSKGSDGQGIRPVSGQENTYTVWGDLTLPEGVEVPEGAVLTGNGSLTSKLEQSAPGAPTLSTCTSTIVTLSAPSDAFSGKTLEYSCVAGNGEASEINDWQSNATFSGLSPQTTYTFYARYAGDKFFNASPASYTGLTVVTAPASSAVTIDYAAETISYADTLEVNTSQDFDGTSISSDSSIVSHMGQTVYVRVKAVDGIPASAPTAITIPARPDAPTFSIDNEAEGVTISNEYYYNTTGETATDWTQGTGSLVKVEPGSAIYIYKAATGDAFKSAVQTLTAPAQGTAPSQPLIDYENEKLTGTSEEMQYSTDNGATWTSCTENMALSDLGWNCSALTVQFRTAATDSNYASESVELEIPARSAAPAAPDISDKTDHSITINAASGVQYRLGEDDQWQTSDTGSLTFGSLNAGTTYTVNARTPAVIGENPAFASAESSTQVTTKTSAAAAPTVGAADVTDTTITLPYDAA